MALCHTGPQARRESLGDLAAPRTTMLSSRLGILLGAPGNPGALCHTLNLRRSWVDGSPLRGAHPIRESRFWADGILSPRPRDPCGSLEDLGVPGAVAARGFVRGPEISHDGPGNPGALCHILMSQESFPAVAPESRGLDRCRRKSRGTGVRSPCWNTCVERRAKHQGT
jgi:hypothetical protein